MNRENSKQVAGSHTPGPWKVGESADNGLPCVDGIDPKDGSLFEICEVWGEESNISITEMSIANARRIVACVNACEGLSTDELERFGLASAFGTELHQLATKVADTELALFAENQKRQEVERQRDELFTALEQLCREAKAVANDCHRPRYARLDEAICSSRSVIDSVKSGA